MMAKPQLEELQRAVHTARQLLHDDMANDKWTPNSAMAAGILSQVDDRPLRRVRRKPARDELRVTSFEDKVRADQAEGGR